jgi:hypothetical protein
MYLCGRATRTSAEVEAEDVPSAVTYAKLEAEDVPSTRTAAELQSTGARMTWEVDVLWMEHSLDHCIV